MIWLVIIIILIILMGIAQQYLSEKSKNVILNAALSILALIISGLVTRIIFMRLSAWFAGWSAAGGAYAILTGVAGMILVAVLFILLAIVLFVVFKKIIKR